MHIYIYIYTHAYTYTYTYTYNYGDLATISPTLIFRQNNIDALLHISCQRGETQGSFSCLLFLFKFSAFF